MEKVRCIDCRHYCKFSESYWCDDNGEGFHEFHDCCMNEKTSEFFNIMWQALEPHYAGPNINEKQKDQLEVILFPTYCEYPRKCLYFEEHQVETVGIPVDCNSCVYFYVGHCKNTGELKECVCRFDGSEPGDGDKIRYCSNYIPDIWDIYERPYRKKDSGRCIDCKHYIDYCSVYNIDFFGGLIEEDIRDYCLKMECETKNKIGFHACIYFEEKSMFVINFESCSTCSYFDSIEKKCMFNDSEIKNIYTKLHCSRHRQSGVYREMDYNNGTYNIEFWFNKLDVKCYDLVIEKTNEIIAEKFKDNPYILKKFEEIVL